MEMLSNSEKIVRMDGVGYVSELMLRCDGLFFDIVSADANGAGGWPQDAGDGTQCSSFAGSVGANQSDNFARFDGKGQVTDGGEIGIVFGELFELDNGGGLVHWNAVIGQYDGLSINCQELVLTVLMDVGQVRGRTVTRMTAGGPAEHTMQSAYQ